MNENNSSDNARKYDKMPYDIGLRACTPKEAELLMHLAMPRLQERIDALERAKYISPELWRQRIDI